MGSEVVRRAVAAGKRVLWLAHRTELIAQASEAIRLAIGQPVSTDLTAPFAQVYVTSIQTLLAGKARPEVDILACDECHHIVAAEWSSVLSEYSSARILGLTATPTRLDEVPLGTGFGQMVNAVHYSELLRAGHLVDCTVYSPQQRLEKGIAMEPVDAYRRYADGKRGFVYVRTKAEADELAQSFAGAGIPAASITDATPKGERASRIDGLRDGSLRVLTNVYTRRNLRCWRATVVT
jgi:superfamily II DNA or RNA helicase